MKVLRFCQGWNSLERLPKENEHNNETIYLSGGFSNFLQKLFVEKITEEKVQLNTIVKRICLHEEEQYVDLEIIQKDQQIQNLSS